MKDEPKRPSDPGEPSQSSLNFNTVDKLIVVQQPRIPEIPEGKGRTCPQCLHTAWARSRFCWHCGFDFDRAELPRCHPRKLLIVAVCINLTGLLGVLICHLNGFRW